MITISSNNLSPLVDLFSKAESTSQLMIRKKDKGYQCELKPLGFFQRHFPSWIQNTEGRESIQHLTDIVGSSRVERMINREELKGYRQAFHHKSLPLDRKFLELIFLQLGNITREDLQEKASLQGRNIKELKRDDIDKIYRDIIPFDQIQDLFFGNVPNLYFDRVASSGKGIEGLRERVAIQLDSFIRQTDHPFGTEEKKWIYDVELLTSRLGDREPPVGTVVRVKDGYLIYDATFTGYGGYASVLRDFTGQRAVLICRGTASRLNATGGLLSGLNNVLLEAGMWAVQSIWPQLQQYLLVNQIQEIELYGKSQGGAHVQYLAPLIAKGSNTHVSRLVTYASIGVSDEAQQIFQDTFQQNAPEIHAIYNGGDDTKSEFDFIPLVGGYHVGESQPSESIRIHSIMPETSQNSRIEDLSLSVLGKLRRFLQSFSNAHIRQTTLSDFKVEVSDSSYLKRGKELEMFRRAIAHLFNFLTLGLLNWVSYKVYFNHTASDYRQRKSGTFSKI